MKKIIYFIFAICILTISSSNLFAEPDCSKLPQLSTPPTAVNDFANILDNATRQNLEQKLRDYFNTTTISIVVVTVKSLDGRDEVSYTQDLFDCWGPGGKNNAGVIFLIAPTEQRARIHTGYGLEGTLTDAVSIKILSNEVKPWFKKNDYSTGIAKGVEGIIAVTGPESGEQREAAKRIREEEQRITKQKITDTVITSVVILAICVIMFFVIIWIKIAIQNQRKRNALQAALNHQTDEIANARKLIAELYKDCQGAPSWAQTEATEHMIVAVNNIDKAESLLNKVKNSIDSEFEKADSMLLQVRTLIDKAESNFTSVNQNIRTKVKKFALDAPVLAKNSQDFLIASIVKVTNLISEGYFFEGALVNLSDLKTVLEEKIKHLGDNEYDYQICRDCKVILDKAKTLVDSFEQTVYSQNQIDKNLPEIIKMGYKALNNSEQSYAMVESFKKNYPESVWLKLETDLHRLSAKLDSSKLYEIETEIKNLNSMKVQKFQVALIKWKSLTDTITDLNNVVTNIEEVNNSQQNAKRNYQQRFSSAQSAINTALSKVKDSDVSSSTKNLAKNAAAKLREVGIEAATSLVDWIALIALLNSASELAKDAVRKAEDDIDDAERERKRKRDEAAKKREDESYSITSYTSSSISSGSDSGFGGFGGGSSGGGGASIGW